MVDGIKQSQSNVAIVPPSILEELVQEVKLLEYCANNLDCIIYCGGDLPQQVGDIVAAKIPLYNQYGSTELGLTPMILSTAHRRQEDWKYLEFHPNLGLQFRPAMDDQYELCMVRQKLVESQQLVFTYPGFTDTSEYATGDLFEGHPLPEKSGMWAWRGRRDDIIVLTNGEKINPIGMEHCIISRSTVITGALVAGSQQFQPILLVEIKQDDCKSESKARNELLEYIWPTIVEVNQIVPSYARIERTNVLFTESGKPMRRSAKGTIQRAATIKLYQEEIEAVNAAVALDSSVGREKFILRPNQISSHEAVADFIQEVIKDITGWDCLGEGDDFYVRGMDSQQTLGAVRILRRGFPGTIVSPDMLYGNPSVTALTQTLVNMYYGNDIDTEQTTISKELKNRDIALQTYHRMIDEIPHVEPSYCRSDKHIILLTDSINGVGPYMLVKLLKHPSVSHVYCLMDGDNGQAGQMRTNRFRHLDPNMDAFKVTFLKGDLSREDLSLPSGVIENIRRSTTMIIHNAWPINLNWEFSSYQPHFVGLINLLRFCAVAYSRPKFFWVSSIGALLKLLGDSGSLPEEVVKLDQPSVKCYGESRYVGEQLLQYAHDRLDVQVFHAVNLHPVNWRVVHNIIIEETQHITGQRLKSITLQQWVQQIQVEHESYVSGSDHAHNRNQEEEGDRTLCRRKKSGLHSAMRMLDFYRHVFASEAIHGLPETEKTAKSSAVLRSIPAVQDEWIRKWVREWVEAFS